MTWWQYLILANVYLILFYGFYALLLRRETFFQLNRFYLVSSAILSFLVPLIQADWARNLFITQRIKQTIYHLEPIVIYQINPVQSKLTIGAGLAVIYIIGIVFLTLRFALQIYLLQRSLRKPGTEDAYSFFKTIKLNEQRANHDVIMAHEEVHAQQWHSADVLLIEAIMIINWFNPAVYFYRKSIKHIHEFIADRDAVKSGTSKQEYALLLLSETFKTPAHQLVNPFFNHSLLKQRILMLQKNNSQRTQLLKYGLSAPLFALMLILSSATVNTNRMITIINSKAERVMMTPATAPAIEDAYTVIASSAGDKLTTMLTRNPPVRDFEPSGKPPSANELADTTKDTELFTVVEHSPSFKGGLKEFGKYLSHNIKVPGAGIHTRVFVGFIIEKDGSITHVKAMREPNTPAAKEAVRVIAASPKWNPGMQNGQKVRVQYVVPVQFNQADNNTSMLVRPAVDSDVYKQNLLLQSTVTGYGNLINTVNPDTVKKLLTVIVRPVNTHVVYRNNGISVRTVPYGTFKQSTIYDRALTDTLRKPFSITYVARNNISGSGAIVNPLYYLDGAEINAADMKAVAPNDILSINVLKGKDAMAEYGDKAINGVVIITTKKKGGSALQIKN